MSKPPTASAGLPTTPPPKPPADPVANAGAPSSDSNNIKWFAEIFGSTVVAISAISMAYDFFFSDRFSFLRTENVLATEKVQTTEKVQAAKVEEVVTSKEQKTPYTATEKVKVEEDISIFEKKKSKKIEGSYLVCPNMHEDKEPCPEKKRSFQDECPPE